MYYVVDSDKPFEQAAEDLRAAVQEGGFGVLHVHDLGNTLRSKGQEFAEECQVFEVCNPEEASRVLGVDMRLNMALPCRVSVYTEGGRTRIGMIRPLDILRGLSDDPTLAETGARVEQRVIEMIDAAR
jgi:uncharacterized protein (DUF302 family)